MGIRSWELQLPGCHSLKEKRGILLSLKSNLRKGLNVSVAETGHQDAWQSAEIACAVVGSSRDAVRGTLQQADGLVERADGLRIVDTQDLFV